MDVTRLHVGVVGASLAGLSIANVLERAGAAVTLLERGDESFSERGGGLGVSLALARAVTGDRAGAPRHTVHDRRRVWARGREWEEPAAIPVTAYGVLWRWLRDHLRASHVQHGRQVVRIDEAPGGARVTTSDTRTEAFDLVVAADGGASELRRRIDGAAGERRYAGYVLWRGLVPAARLDDGRFELVRRFHIASRGNHHLVAYAIPGPEAGTAAGVGTSAAAGAEGIGAAAGAAGSGAEAGAAGSDAAAGAAGTGAGTTASAGAQAERALVNWGWYHPWAPEALPALDGRSRTLSPHALGRDEDALAAFDAVCRRDRGRWPDWVRHILERSREHGVIAPHPVYDLVPAKLAGGRVVLAGDAAHLASPITGSGARMAMEDALALGAALSAAPTIEAALAAYAEARRAAATAVVLEGRQIGAAFAVPDGA